MASGLIGTLGVLLAPIVGGLLHANGHSEGELSGLTGIIAFGVGGAGLVTAFGALVTLISHFSWWRKTRSATVSEAQNRKGPAIMLVGAILWLVAFLLIDLSAGNTGADFPPMAYILPGFLILASIGNYTTKQWPS